MTMNKLENFLRHWVLIKFLRAWVGAANGNLFGVCPIGNKFPNKDETEYDKRKPLRTPFGFQSLPLDVLNGEHWTAPMLACLLFEKKAQKALMKQLSMNRHIRNKAKKIIINNKNRNLHKINLMLCNFY